MEKDWLFATDEYICDLRTVSVLIKDNKILVQRDKDGNEYALPGGHVKIGETLENGLIRETMEEMLEKAYTVRDRYTVLTLAHELGIMQAMKPMLMEKYF